MRILCDRNSEMIPNASEIINKEDNLCVVDWSKRMLDLARQESCGKCVMCREGIMQVYTIVDDATTGRGEPEDIELVSELAEVIMNTSSCKMARKAAENLIIAVRNYPEEWEMHVKRKRCIALVCKEYLSMHILPEDCHGCVKCMEVCPEGAISGEDGLIHVIDQEKCSRCGKCMDACKYEAIRKAGAVKPKTPEKPVPVGSWETGRRRRRRGQ